MTVVQLLRYAATRSRRRANGIPHYIRVAEEGVIEAHPGCPLITLAARLYADRGGRPIGHSEVVEWPVDFRPIYSNLCGGSDVWYN